MAFGTAPHRIGSDWYTRSGRKLSAKGQHYWDTEYRLGNVTIDGHYNHQRAALTHAAKNAPTRAARVAAGQAVGAQDSGGHPTGGVGHWLGSHVVHPVTHTAHAVTNAAAGGVESLLPGGGWGAGGHRQKHGLGRSTTRVQEKAGKAIKDVGDLTIGSGLTDYVTGTDTGLPTLSAGADIAMLPFLGVGKGARGIKAIHDAEEAAVVSGRAARAARQTKIERAGLKGHH